MGRLESSQDRFFYNFCLDDVVPADHLVRRIDVVPDHSVFSRARHERFRESEVFRQVFETRLHYKPSLWGHSLCNLALTATAQNLRKLARYVNRPPPIPATG